MPDITRTFLYPISYTPGENLRRGLTPPETGYLSIDQDDGKLRFHPPGGGAAVELGGGGDADTLDGQLPAYYLDRANHTGNVDTFPGTGGLLYLSDQAGGGGTIYANSVDTYAPSLTLEMDVSGYAGPARATVVADEIHLVLDPAGANGGTQFIFLDDRDENNAYGGVIHGNIDRTGGNLSAYYYTAALYFTAGYYPDYSHVEARSGKVTMVAGETGQPDWAQLDLLAGPQGGLASGATAILAKADAIGLQSEYYEAYLESAGGENVDIYADSGADYADYAVAVDAGGHYGQMYFHANATKMSWFLQYAAGANEIVRFTYDGATKIGFHNATPVAQQAAPTAPANTATTQTTPYGFATQQQGDDLVAAVLSIRTALLNYGLLV